MKKLHFENIDALAEFIVCEVADCDHVVAALFFNEAKALTKALLQYDSVEIAAIDMNEEAYDGYDREYYVSLLDGHELFVDKAFSDSRYLRNDADIMLISPDASSTIVCLNDETNIFETYIGEDDDGCEYTIMTSHDDDDDDDDCAECECDCHCGCDCHCHEKEVFVNLADLGNITLLDAIIAIANAE